MLAAADQAPTNVIAPANTAEICPPAAIVMVVPSTLTPPSWVVVACTKRIVPLVLVKPELAVTGTITPPSVDVFAAGNVYCGAEIIPLLIVIVVLSTLTPPIWVLLAVASPIVPLEFVKPLADTSGTLTPPNALVVAAGNVYSCAPVITPVAGFIVIVVPSGITPPSVLPPVAACALGRT